MSYIFNICISLEKDYVALSYIGFGIKFGPDFNTCAILLLNCHINALSPFFVRFNYLFLCSHSRFCVYKYV